ncbi:hypothetical protein AB0M54_35610 [Actinoplanes sp. NPDC051470]|uniref:hypothetical protein n=1 Tax=Actinoplanes sp. NPDC051470 TaxID=3157224 RepID=UPI0034383155
MSVDSSGNLPTAVTLAAVLDATRTTMHTLLGVTRMPDLLVETDVHTARRPVLRPEQESTVLGGLDRIEDGDHFWEIRPAGFDDRVRVIMHRLLDQPVDPAALTDDEDDLWLHPSLGCDPMRTGVAMALSVGLALAAATVGGGHFSTQLTVWRPGCLDDPAEVIAGTKVSPTDLPFRDACIRYMDQFPDSRPGWGW